MTVAELYEGVLYGGDVERNEATLLRFLRGVRVLPIDRRIARRFALTRGYLRDIG